MTTEFKVGILVLLGIILLFYMSFRIGKFGSFTEGPGYEVSAHFKNVAGLDTKSPVEIAGVEVGRVNKVSLDGTMAKTALLMKENTKIPIDSKVSIKSFGILGDKYLEITPGQSPVMARNGDELKNVVSYADYDEIFQNVSVAARNIGDTVEQFKGIMSEKDKENLKASLANIQVASSQFRDILTENKGNVNRIVANVAAASSKLGPMADKANTTIARIDTMVEGVEQGKGTLGKLVNDPSLYVEAQETMKNVNQFTGTLKDGNLVNEAEKTMKKVQQAAEGVQEQTPISILGTIFGLFF